MIKPLKNYFTVFFITYIVILATKFLFLFLVAHRIEITPLLGYKYDFAISAFLALVTTFFDKSKKLFANLTAILITSIFLLQIGDTLYFKESSRHISYEVFDIFTDAKSLFMTAFSQYTILTLISLLVIPLLFIMIKKLINKNYMPVEFSKSYILSKLLLIMISVFFIRGMFQHIPLTPWQANSYGSDKAPFVVNGSYTTLYAVANSKKKLAPLKLKSFPKDEIKTTIKSLYHDKEEKKLPLLNDKPNIVFFFLESWSAAYLKPYGFSKTTTPNFNSLLEKSIHPKAMIASGHRTTEGMFATLVSYQNPLGKSVAKSQLQNFHYTSIIDILNKNGYSSAFFQGTAKDTSGTGSLAQSLGFKKSYGKRDIKEKRYPNNYWGVQDPDLYNFVTKKLSSSLKEPFVIGINGATTHDDKLPPSVKKIDFTQNQKLNNQLNALHFSDKALGDFINEIEKKYPNTIFVLFADHCGGGLGGTMQNYLIPFAIYSKKLSAKSFDTFISQRDIAPTVLDIAIQSYKKVAPNFSGKSLLSDKSFFADYFHNGILGWIKDNRSVEINIYNNYKTTCYKIQNLKKRKTTCTKEYDILKNEALIFTNLSQKLLFEGKTEEFHKWRVHE